MKPSQSQIRNSLKGQMSFLDHLLDRYQGTLYEDEQIEVMRLRIVQTHNFNAEQISMLRCHIIAVIEDARARAAYLYAKTNGEAG
jgi:hypothetical protein